MAVIKWNTKSTFLSFHAETTSTVLFCSAEYLNLNKSFWVFMLDYRRSLGSSLVHLQKSKWQVIIKKIAVQTVHYEITNPLFKLLCLVRWRIYYQMMVPLVLLTSSDDYGVCVDNSICETSRTQWETVLINHDYKTSCGLIRNGLFTNWKFRFDSDPRLHDLKPSCTWGFPLCILVLYRELIPSSFLK